MLIFNDWRKLSADSVRSGGCADSGAVSSQGLDLARELMVANAERWRADGSRLATICVDAKRTVGQQQLRFVRAEYLGC